MVNQYLASTPLVVTDNYRWVIKAETTIFQFVLPSPKKSVGIKHEVFTKVYTASWNHIIFQHDCIFPNEKYENFDLRSKATDTFLKTIISNWKEKRDWHVLVTPDLIKKFDLLITFMFSHDFSSFYMNKISWFGFQIIFNKIMEMSFSNETYSHTLKGKEIFFHTVWILSF